MEKAYWVNHQYLKITDPAVIAPEFDWHLRRVGVDPANGSALTAVIEQQRERCKTLVEMAEKSKFFFADLDGYNDKDAAKHFTAEAGQLLEELVQSLSSLSDWSAPALHAAVNGLAERKGLGLGKIAQPIRVAVAGMAVSPPIDQTLLLLGRERTLARLTAAIQHIQSKS
jgi:glutamyl-tRNA synthetase